MHTTANPTSPAIRPCSSAVLPSVADTCEREISFNRSGRAPDCSSLARFCAVVIVKPPEICEPVEASIPSGYSVKSIDGTVISWPSSSTAKCCRASFLVTPGSWASWPRWAISLVIRSKIALPLLVKPKVTLGWPDPPAPSSKPCWGLVMSDPFSTGSSLRT